MVFSLRYVFFGLFLLSSVAFTDESYQWKNIVGRWGQKTDPTGKVLEFVAFKDHELMGYSYSDAYDEIPDEIFQFQYETPANGSQAYFAYYFNDVSDHQNLNYYYVDPTNPDRLIGKTGVSWNCSDADNGIDSMSADGKSEVFDRVL